MSRTAPRPEIELGLAQNSRDKLPVKFRLGRLETTTKALVRLKACPTMPGAKVAPFSSVPLFPATISDVLPSPGHQPTIPAGAGTHWAAAEGPKRTTLTDSPVPTNIEAYFVFIVCLALNIWRRACRRTLKFSGAPPVVLYRPRALAASSAVTTCSAEHGGGVGPSGLAAICGFVSP